MIGKLLSQLIRREGVAIVLLQLLLTLHAVEISDVKESRVGGSDSVNWKQWSYTRGGEKILTSTTTAPEKNGIFSTAMHEIRQGGKTVLVVTFVNLAINGLSTGPGSGEIRIEVSDHNRDGVPDLIWLRTIGGVTLDVFTIVHGAVEPLSDEHLVRFKAELAGSSRETAFFDKVLPELINAKLRETSSTSIKAPRD